MALTSMKSLDSVEYNEDDYGPRLEEALFGQLTTQDGNGEGGGEELQGDSFGTCSLCSLRTVGLTTEYKSMFQDLILTLLLCSIL